ncbi:mitochondrial enolase superfamily member 1 [Grus japonensis]|uniref:Mitochondrial enolase superfamily member 1 n=1 Tax=Grus japonensis TaxID=30415 RepID=A0ABC9VW64_GRUJA
MDGYKLFRRDRQGRRGGGLALCVRENLELDDGDDRVECIWVRIRGNANKEDIMVGCCYRPPSQDEEADEIFYKQLGEVSRLLALFLMGDFNLPDVRWKYSTAERKQSMRFLECVEENFLTQLVSEPTREGGPLDLLLVNRGGLVGDVMVGDHLECSDPEMMRVFDSQRRGNIVSKDEEKAEILNAAFASVFSRKTNCSLRTQLTELEDRDVKQNEAPIILGEMVSNLPHHLDMNKSMGPGGIHPWVLREVVKVLTKPFSIIYQQSWLTGEVPLDWRLANVMPIYKKGRKEDLGNYRPVSLTSVLGKVMKIILSAITWHVQDNQVIRPSQHGFMKGQSCLTNLISFYDKVTCLVDEGKAADVAYLDFSKDFNTISHSILLEKLAAHGLGGRTLLWRRGEERREERGERRGGEEERRRGGEEERRRGGEEERRRGGEEERRRGGGGGGGEEEERRGEERRGEERRGEERRGEERRGEERRGEERRGEERRGEERRGEERREEKRREEKRREEKRREEKRREEKRREEKRREEKRREFVAFC